MKHTSTVLEPSILFNTLVKLVDAENIANDKIRTQDLTLESNSNTNQLQSQDLDTQQQPIKYMFTQPKDPNNKHKPANKKYCSYGHKTNHLISACFIKHRDDEERRDAYARSRSPQKSFVKVFRSSSRENNSYRTTKPTDSLDRYRSRRTSRHSNTNRNVSSEKIYRSQSRDRYEYDRPTIPHNLSDQVKTIIDGIHALIVHHTDLLIYRHVEEVHALDVDHVHTPETGHFRITRRHLDLVIHQEIPDFFDLHHVLRQEVKQIPFNHRKKSNSPILTSMSTCTFPQRWLTL